MKFQFIIQKRQRADNQFEYSEPAIEFTLAPEEYKNLFSQLELFDELHAKFDAKAGKITISLSYLDEKISSSPVLTDPTALRSYLCSLKEFFGGQDGTYNTCKEFSVFIEKNKNDLLCLNVDKYQKSLETDFPELHLSHVKDNLRPNDKSSRLSLWSSDLAKMVGNLFWSNGKAALEQNPLKPVTQFNDEEFNNCKKMLDDIFHNNKSIQYNSSSFGNMYHEFTADNIEPIKRLVHELKEKSIINFVDEIIEKNSYSFRVTQCDLNKLRSYHSKFLTSGQYKQDSINFGSLTGSLIVTDSETFPSP